MRSVLIAAATLTVTAALATPAQAKPFEQLRFVDDPPAELVDDFCGDLQVLVDLRDQGVLVGRSTGPDRTLRYTQSHHGEITFTNVATGLAFRIGWNYLNQDLRVTVNNDGTISILNQIPGPETIYGPDGKRLSTSGGTIRYLTVLDYHGTLGDPSDDTFVSETVVSSNGGPAQPDFDFCEQFHALTA